MPASVASLIGVLFLLAGQAAAQEPRQQVSLNAGWSFALQSAAGNGEPGRFQPVDLPHTWNSADSRDKTAPYFRGEGIYRRSLDIDASMAGKRLYLYFEGANQVATVFVNGERAGRHVGGYTAFAVDITRFAKPGGANALEVRVDNRHNRHVPPLNADFTFYGGLYRDVRLLALDPVHFNLDEFGATEVTIRTESLTERHGRVRVSAVLHNASDRHRDVQVTTVLVDAAGSEIARLTRSGALAADALASHELAVFEIDSPALWSPESPHLYRVICTISAGRQVLDRVDYPLGLRWFHVDAQTGFHLNGKPYRLFGTNRHQDYPGLGNALPDELHRSDLQKIRQDGFNFLRLAHYPQDPAVLDAADELGLIVWEEVPIVNLIDTSPLFRDNGERMLREMVRQHRHHPSIAFWGYMNEVTLRRPDPVPPGYADAVVALAAHLDRVAKQEDPSRPTVMAVSLDELRDEIPLETVADILAFNLYFGWYYHDVDALGGFLDDYHRDHPDRPLMISEYGAGSDERVHSPDAVRFDFSTEYQQRFHEANFAQIMERPWLAGSAVWNQFDFGSNHRQDTKFAINQKGLWYFDRRPKDVAHFYRAQLSDRPVLHIAARDWPLRAGSRPGDETTPIKVYSNAATVELQVNGVSLGGRDVENATAVWNVTLRGGDNTVVARSPHGEDRVVVRYEDRSPLFGDAAADSALAVNAGGHEQFVDGRGRVWEGDRAYVAGSWGYVGGTAERSHHRIFGTDDDPLYQTRRSGPHGYRFDVPDGDYCATLHFADHGPVADAGNSFPVYVDERMLATPAFDAYTATAVERAVAVSDGRGLTIAFDDGASDPFVNGIELQRGHCPAGALPNVLFILADDIGYGDLGAYGGELATPNIDSLAEAGMRFTDAHSPAALCAPSRFSLMTGSYPYRNGRPGGSWDLDHSSGFSAGASHLVEGRHLTVGEVLQRAGYRTGFIGKMHFGGDVFDRDGNVIREKHRLNEMDFSRGIRNGVNAHGFDYSFGLASGIQHEPYAYFENGRYRPVDPSDRPDNSSTVLLHDGRYAVGNNGTSEIVEAGDVPARADRNYDSSQVGPTLTRKAVEFIDAHLRENRDSGRDRPFALYLASQAIHVPHTPPIDFDGDPEPLDRPVAGVSGGATTDMIGELDMQVGALLEKLEAAGELDDTLVFFTSDNGGLAPDIADYGGRGHDSNGPWRDYKSSVYEGGHRVPFIVRWGDGTAPGSKVRPGSTSGHTIVNHDWVATIYDVTGQRMSADQAMDSASLLPLLLGESDAGVHEFILYQAGYARVGAIREGPYVLVVDEQEQASELYDLDADPAQARNLVAEPGQQSRVDALLRRFLRYNDRDDASFDEPRTTDVLRPARP